MRNLLHKLKITLEMIKFEHTLFALPFAFLGAVLAADGIPDVRKILWITAAMVGARSAAMTFNRIVDRDIDAANPRTAGRELPTGRLTTSFAWAFLMASVGLFIFSAYLLNPLAFALSPVALISILGYSYAKRVTALSHLFLGWALAIAPTAAWIAVRGAIDSELPLFLSLFVLMWTAGFDVLYACQDRDFDKSAGLHSIPARFGIARSLWIARLFHLQAFVVLVLLFIFSGLGWPAGTGVAAVGLLLAYQHTLVKPSDLSRLNAAFFTTNAFVSIILFLSFSAAVFIAK